jgi:hypothetical protein
MSQEFNITPVKRPKNSLRSQRNRPVLVTGNSVAKEQAIATVESQPSESTPAISVVEPAPKRKLPNFFSTIGKSDKETTDKPEVDQAQARLARATHGNKSVTQNSKAVTKEDSLEKGKETAKPATTKSTPTRPPGLFKTRHIIGIAIYLLAANFVGIIETTALRSIHADVVLTTFVLFGGKVTITSSTVAFLATLVIILILLAKFDFIPRSLGGSSAARNNKSATSSSKSADAIKTSPPVIRPGVKGSDDKLYETYRLNQRRDKKR